MTVDSKWKCKTSKIALYNKDGMEENTSQQQAWKVIR